MVALYGHERITLYLLGANNNISLKWLILHDVEKYYLIPQPSSVS